MESAQPRKYIASRKLLEQRVCRAPFRHVEMVPDSTSSAPATGGAQAGDL